MILTTEQLERMIPYASDGNLRKYYMPLNETLEAYEIYTPIRIAAFIAQITHESGSLRYVREIADGGAYEYRKDLGNLEEDALNIAHSKGTTTGKFYKGRGLIQCTGYYNYLACGKDLNIDLIHNPELLEKPKWAARSAGWFWDKNNLNLLADREEFTSITKRINGGYNGIEKRQKYYKHNLNILQETFKS